MDKEKKADVNPKKDIPNPESNKGNKNKEEINKPSKENKESKSQKKCDDPKKARNPLSNRCIEIESDRYGYLAAAGLVDKKTF